MKQTFVLNSLHLSGHFSGTKELLHHVTLINSDDTGDQLQSHSWCVSWRCWRCWRCKVKELWRPSNQLSEISSSSYCKCCLNVKFCINSDWYNTNNSAYRASEIQSSLEIRQDFHKKTRSKKAIRQNKIHMSEFWDECDFFQLCSTSDLETSFRNNNNGLRKEIFSSNVTKILLEKWKHNRNLGATHISRQLKFCILLWNFVKKSRGSVFMPAAKIRKVKKHNKTLRFQIPLSLSPGSSRCK